MSSIGWRVHGDGRRVTPGAVVEPDERLTWPRTIGIGMQHVVAMFGATILVPAITGFPASTTLFFSAVGTVLFLVITGNRLPSYLGSSFAFIAPVMTRKSTVPTAEKNSVVEAGNPVIAGTRIVAPNIATTCCMPIPTVRGQLNRSSGLTTAPGRIRRPSPCTRHPIVLMR